jgi:hypothetical protein
LRDRKERDGGMKNICVVWRARWKEYGNTARGTGENGQQYGAREERRWFEKRRFSEDMGRKG